jgi:hypothetical protein
MVTYYQTSTMNLKLPQNFVYAHQYQLCLLIKFILILPITQYIMKLIN